MRASRFRHSSLPYLYVNLATLFWAGNMTLGRVLRDQIGPFTLTTARVGVAAILLLVLFRRLPDRDRRIGRDGWLLLGMALTGMVGFPVLLYYALRFTTATNAALINGTGPLVTAALAAVLLRDRLRAGQITGAILSLFGVALVIGATGSGNGFRINPGDALMLVAVVLWGFYSIMGRVVMGRRSNLSATAFATWLALPLLLLLAGLEWRTMLPVFTPISGAAVLYIGVFAAFFAVIFWNEGVRRLGPSGAMAFYNMLPVFGVLLGALFLGERLSGTQLVGAALVVLGGLISALWNTSASPKTASNALPR